MSENADITDKEQPSAEIRTCSPEITSVHDDALVLCEAVQAMSEREAVKTVETVHAARPRRQQISSVRSKPAMHATVTTQR